MFVPVDIFISPNRAHLAKSFDTPVLKDDGCKVFKCVVDCSGFPTSLGSVTSDQLYPWWLDQSRMLKNEQKPQCSGGTAVKYPNPPVLSGSLTVQTVTHFKQSQLTFTYHEIFTPQPVLASLFMTTFDMPEWFKWHHDQKSSRPLAIWSSHHQI